MVLIKIYEWFINEYYSILQYWISLKMVDKKNIWPHVEQLGKMMINHGILGTTPPISFHTGWWVDGSVPIKKKNSMEM